MVTIAARRRHYAIAAIATAQLALVAPVLVLAGGSGQWTPAASMSTARRYHTATALPSGRVLVAGGDDGTHVLASSELFLPAANAWVPTASMTTRRHLHTATLLADNRVLVAGGSTGPGGILSTAELYDPTRNVWIPAGSMATPHAAATAVLLTDGRVLLSGGMRSGAGDAQASAEVYDPQTNAWSSAGHMSSPQGGHTLTLLAGGKVLLVGGDQPQLYDPASNAWSAAGTMHHPRTLHTATRLKTGQVLVVGGHAEVPGGANPQTDGTEIYDPDTNTWREGAQMSTTRSDFSATLLPDGRVVVAGGGNANGQDLYSAEWYDPGANLWSSAGTLGASRAEHSGILLPDGRVMIVGGIGPGPGDATATAEVYEPSQFVASSPDGEPSATQVGAPPSSSYSGAQAGALTQVGVLNRLAGSWLVIVAALGLVAVAGAATVYARRRRRGV